MTDAEIIEAMARVDVRDAFEAWALADCRDLTPLEFEERTPTNYCYYETDSVNEAYIGWCAAFAICAPAVRERCAEWRPIETAPKDGTMLQLLVQFEEHATEDSPDPCVTIGANMGDNTGEDRWTFAGWDWCHDCFTEGKGTPVGWLPLARLPAAPAESKGEKADD